MKTEKKSKSLDSLKSEKVDGKNIKGGATSNYNPGAADEPGDPGVIDPASMPQIESGLIMDSPIPGDEFEG